MITKELREAAVEIDCIFDNMTAETLKQIPKNFRDFFKQISSETYTFQYDKSKSLDKQQLLPKTKGILALIYRDYLCDEIEKKKYTENCNKVLANIEQQKYEMYNPNNIFKEKNNIQPKEEFLPTVYKPVSLIKRILNQIKNIFIKE